MLSRALLLSFCTAALQLVSNNSKTFYRVDKALSWEEAMWHCQEHYTDLADLESLNSMNGIRTLSSLIKDAAAWIGLFYDKYSSGLSWSSGSTFTSISWNDLPDIREGFCAMLYLQYDDTPHLGAASCTAQKPFICYYDRIVGHRFSRASSQEGIFTLPEKATVLIGGWNFTRITHNMSWSLALNYCRNHYTDLADLQVVRNAADIATLKHLTTAFDAWIGLYASPKSNSLTWSSGWDAGIPQWVENQPLLHAGLCAGIRSFANKNPRIYARTCSELRHFICYYGDFYGILKADFIISGLNDPEKMEDQFMREIQEVLKLILGHEQFMLKWVSLEVNKK
uniref:putative C-type lectin domain family 20 member A n=1 Tax=Jaculus jaculus TaxID=51337 RepID=UPI001E1B07F2|nr:putative C-type lectin domain family 20 member A [Jaculus jaculus]